MSCPMSHNGMYIALTLGLGNELAPWIMPDREVYSIDTLSCIMPGAVICVLLTQ